MSNETGEDTGSSTAADEPLIAPGNPVENKPFEMTADVEAYIDAPFRNGRTELPEDEEADEKPKGKGKADEVEDDDKAPEAKATDKADAKADEWLNADLEKVAASWELSREDMLEFGSEKLLTKHLKHLKAIEDRHSKQPESKGSDAGKGQAQDQKKPDQINLPEGLNWDEFDDGTKDVARVLVKHFEESSRKQLSAVEQQIGEMRRHFEDVQFVHAFEALLPADEEAQALLGMGPIARISDKAMRENRLKLFEKVQSIDPKLPLQQRLDDAYKSLFHDELAKRQSEKHHKRLYDQSRRVKGGTGTPKGDANKAGLELHQDPDLLEEFNALRSSG